MSCCRTVDNGVEKHGKAVHKSRRAVGSQWTSVSSALWMIFYPHPVDKGLPQIHTLLSWADLPSLGLPVDTFGTVRVSPGCGHKIVGTSVDNTRVPAGNRTPSPPDDRAVAASWPPYGCSTTRLEPIGEREKAPAEPSQRRCEKRVGARTEGRRARRTHIAGGKREAGEPAQAYGTEPATHPKAAPSGLRTGHPARP